LLRAVFSAVVCCVCCLFLLSHLPLPSLDCSGAHTRQTHKPDQIRQKTEK
jgi:hypothetical protein